MKQFTVAAVLVLVLAPAFGAPKETKLPTKYAMKFGHAVKLLDAYNGNGAVLEEARAELYEVQKAHPRYAPAYRETARYMIMRGHINSLQFQPGSLEAADLSLKQALDIDPNYAEAFVLYGHLYKLMGRNQDALRALLKAEKLGSSDPWLQNNWADLLIEDGKFEEAARRYRKVIDSQTKNQKATGTALEGLIKYYTAVGKLNEADEMYQKKISFQPDGAWGYGNYAQFLLCRKGEIDGSIAQSRKALAIMDYGVGRYWLAAALYGKWGQSTLQGTPDMAAKYLVEARALYSDPSEFVRNAGSCPPLGVIAHALALSKTPADTPPPKNHLR